MVYIIKLYTMNEFTTQTNILMLRDIILENEETRQLNTEYVEQLLSRNLEAFYSKIKTDQTHLCR